MAGFDISIVGDKKLQKKLNKLPDNVQKKLVRKILRKAFKPVLAAARSRVPVGSGKLKKSMKIKSIKGTRDFVGVRIKTGTRQELDIPKDATGYYPASLEYGTSRLAARPYLRPALNSRKQTTLAIFANELRKELKSIR